MDNQTTNKCVCGGQAELAQLIKKVVCEHFKVSEDIIPTPYRCSPAIDARQILTYFIKKDTDLTLKKIGAITNRDHSTVIWSSDIVQDRMKTNKYYKEEINTIERKIKLAIFGIDLPI